MDVLSYQQKHGERVAEVMKKAAEMLNVGGRSVSDAPAPRSQLGHDPTPPAACILLGQIRLQLFVPHEPRWSTASTVAAPRYLRTYDHRLQSVMTCQAPTTWGFRRNSGPRGSRIGCYWRTPRLYRGPPTGNNRALYPKRRHGARGRGPNGWV